uniref:Metalloendopeptidase n=1 Tax=Panagrolaimus sp. PS1159 TaxID=55785 RepID=A0AC35GL60_9BILA
MRKYNGAKNVAIKEKGNNRWENNIVPYKLSNRYTTSEKLIIENSLKAIEKVSCFRFPKYSNQKNFLDIDKKDGCYSYVGKIGGRQLLSLSEGCVYDFIVIHEVMHVLGLEHEHQRPDRDKYIKIQYQNVELDKMANFGLISPNDVDYNDHPYDYQSIMHYDGTAFGKRDPRTGKKLVTMMPLKTGVQLLDNFELTTLDIAKLNSLGKCSNSADRTTNGGCVDKGSGCIELLNSGMCVQLLDNFELTTLDIAKLNSLGKCSNSADRTTNGGCVDKGSGCIELLNSGMCKNIFYKDLASEHCALTCGYCTTKFEHSPVCEDKV